MIEQQGEIENHSFHSIYYWNGTSHYFKVSRNSAGKKIEKFFYVQIVLESVKNFRLKSNKEYTPFQHNLTCW
jgi:hypothetical protein